MRGCALTAATLCLPFTISSAFTAGYGVHEFSPLAMGTAYAGVSASDEDPSFLPYNPASMAGVDGWDASVGLIAVWPDSDSTVSMSRTVFGQEIDGPRTQAGFVQPAYVPDVAVRYRFSPEWSAGLSVSAPWGLTTIYDPEWAGRYHAHETKLLTVNIAPTIAYQPTSDLSVAVSFNAQYATGRLANAVDIGTIGAAFSVPGSIPGQQGGYGAFDAEDWGFGWTAGIIWKPADWLALGASYRAQIDHTLTGPVDFTIGTSVVGPALVGSGLLLNTRGAADLSTPSVVSAGATIDVSERLTLMAELGLTDWSIFDELRVKFANAVQPDEMTLFRWKDSWFGAVGGRYELDDAWRVSAGVAYDQSPTGAFRNLRIPDADRVMLAFGADVDLSANTTLALSVAHLFLGEEPIGLSSAEPSNVFRGDFASVTDAEATAVALQLTFR